MSHKSFARKVKVSNNEKENMCAWESRNDNIHMCRRTFSFKQRNRTFRILWQNIKSESVYL